MLMVTKDWRGGVDRQMSLSLIQERFERKVAPTQKKYQETDITPHRQEHWTTKLD